MEELRWRYLLPELWLEVMKKLPIGDLCSLSLVSQRLYIISCTPRLWSDCRIRKIKLKNGILSEFFHIERFKKLRKLSLSRLQLKEDSVNIFFENFPFFHSLQSLDLQGVNLSKISPEVVSKSFRNLREREDQTKNSIHFLVYLAFYIWRHLIHFFNETLPSEN